MNMFCLSDLYERGQVVIFVAQVVHLQGSEVPSLGTFSGTLSGKWAKVGKMGVNEGNSDCLVEKWEI